MIFTPPFSYFLRYSKYINTTVTVTKTWRSTYGWTYHAGHFNDGEPFYQLGADLFNNPQVDYSDLDLSAEEIDF